jgi:hypothetical protein
MANLTRYNLMFDKSPGPTLCEMVVDHNGTWVKFADVKELLQTSPNNGSMPCRFFSREKISTGINGRGETHYESVPWCNCEASQHAVP